jgi:hypothetical protein
MRLRGRQRRPAGDVVLEGQLEVARPVPRAHRLDLPGASRRVRIVRSEPSLAVFTRPDRVALERPPAAGAVGRDDAAGGVALEAEAPAALDLDARHEAARVDLARPTVGRRLGSVDASVFAPSASSRSSASWRGMSTRGPATTW